MYLADTEALSDADNIIDGLGKTLIPGLIDAHGHVGSYGLSLLRDELVGTMTEEEAAQFETSTSFRSILALRQWDEMAKDPHATVPDLDHYAPMLIRHLQGN